MNSLSRLCLLLMNHKLIMGPVSLSPKSSDVILFCLPEGHKRHIPCDNNEGIKADSSFNDGSLQACIPS